jgi:transcription initiation factor TFIID subunit 2
MHSPIPSSGPKIKIKTKTVPGSSAPNSRPSTPAPSRPSVPAPRPNAAPAPPLRSGASTPAPRPAPVPPKQSQSKPTKRSKIVKLKLPSEKLAQLKNNSNKKRKLVNGGDDRPSKRQSVEPNGTTNGAGNTGLVKIERSGGEKPKLIVRMKVARFKLPKGWVFSGALSLAQEGDYYCMHISAFLYEVRAFETAKWVLSVVQHSAMAFWVGWVDGYTHDQSFPT